MDIIRRSLYIISGVFTLICLLLLLNIVSREFFLQNFGMVNIESVYNTLLVIALVLLVSMMLVHGMTTAALRTDLQRAENRANDLKARLYDQKHEQMDRQAAQRMNNTQQTNNLPSDNQRIDPFSPGDDFNNPHNPNL
ncbi:MAG: hypothetical protein EOP49_46440 [Sphingobacteriales bacterium]|nr:MAG: hypothetical protein EOP49_46440 [Sphingobacteriales bacterium]